MLQKYDEREIQHAHKEACLEGHGKLTGVKGSLFKTSVDFGSGHEITVYSQKCVTAFI